MMPCRNGRGRTLEHHRDDPRPHLYDRASSKPPPPHDPLLECRHAEMLLTGYMHNHMRMYWGKKILEWSRTPEQAFATALASTTATSCAAATPNSYANVGWCFGLHDRPWPERPVFGTVRSMTAAGLERKTDIDAYVKRVKSLS